MRRTVQTLFAFLTIAAGLAISEPALAQSSPETGKLKIHVSPKQAYVFVDGKAVREGSQSIELPAGKHSVAVRNYGFLPNRQDVTVRKGETSRLDVALQRSGDTVSGPFGAIELKGDPRASVLLNGQTPDYFVGHVDEFDWNWIWHQRLVLKPGAYQVAVKREGNTIWSGPVNVQAGKRTIVYLDQRGRTKVRDWKAGMTMGPQPRFDAGIASATVAVAPVTARLAATPASAGCGKSTDLKWSAANAVDTSISGLGKVDEKGDRSVTPTHKTTYTLTAKGPGGEATQMVTVDVQGQPTAVFAIDRPEVRFHKVGDKIVQQDPATLSWSVSNASSATIDPLGSEAMDGSREVLAQPKQRMNGPVNEYVTYKLTARNACGAEITKTAMLHVTGSIDPPPALTLDSVFFPTAYPTGSRPKVGLLATEKKDLSDLAAHFKNRHQFESKASLMIVGHADVRGTREYNQALSRRRAELVRSYLIAQGISAGRIKTTAEGEDHQLSAKKVRELQSQDAQKPQKWMTRGSKTTWLAYNRRVDIVLQPDGQPSVEMYPNTVAAAHLLWQRHEPALRKVEMAERSPAAHMALRGAPPVAGESR